MPNIIYNPNYELIRNTLMITLTGNSHSGHGSTNTWLWPDGYATPKSPMGMALNYAIQRWDNLLNYLYDGSLEIDNNWVENAIRPNALGRKNYLFAGSHEGAKRAAMFYSFFGTCKKNNVNPYQWFKKVLEIIPAYPANKIADLLPQNLKLV